MDRECLLLLPQVCEVLLESSSSLADDTILEKLLDWFTGLGPAEDGSLLDDHPCLLNFISAAIHRTSLEPALISFVLKLCGSLAASSGAFTVLQNCSVLDLVFNQQHWQNAGLWDDPCIRVGWIHGLRNLLQNSASLSFFVQGDLVGTLLHLQTDSSLFVASAANQLLSHILLFFQPVTANGERLVEDAEGQDWATDTDRPEASVETSRDYSAVFRTILEFTKESLLHHHDNGHNDAQTQQRLRFLSMVLDRAGPVLRDLMLQSVTDALKKLVRAGQSQLTHSLMEVIVAAHRGVNSTDRVTDGHVSDLLSSMLNVTKPLDLVHAAAAFLHKGKPDDVFTARAVRILLLPLEVITGHHILSRSNTEEPPRVSLLEELRRKSSCISILCTCLRNTPRISAMSPDQRPCPPDVIVTAVLWLLRISGGEGTTTDGSTELFKNIVGSSKVQKCCLEALTAFSCSPGVEAEVKQVFPVLLRCLHSPDSDPTVIHKSYQTLVKWLAVCEDPATVTEEMRQDLSDAVRKRVCDMRWEVRDSTLEFLGKLAGEMLEPFLDSRCSMLLLREALQDVESYVRASAISALVETLRPSWQQGAAVTEEQRDIVKRLLEILSQDSEGFPRRAVVQYFITWFSSSSLSSASSSCSSCSSSLLMSSVSSVLSLGSSDLDWEVKVHTLELTELLLDQLCCAPSDPPAALERLVEVGVVSALMQALEDCDRPVGLKACQLLIRLRDTLCPPSPDVQQDVSSSELPGHGRGRGIGKSSRWQKNGDVEAAVELMSGCDSCRVRLCPTLMSLNLETRLETLSQSSDHVYNSALSLLQDIILTARRGRTHPDTPAEVIVDCY